MVALSRYDSTHQALSVFPVSCHSEGLQSDHSRGCHFGDGGSSLVLLELKQGTAACTFPPTTTLERFPGGGGANVAGALQPFQVA